MGPVPEQGEVYRVILEGIGHEERGPHYAVVVSDEAYNVGSTVVVVPFSSRAREAVFHPATVIRGTRTRAMVEQLRAVDRSRLREQVGFIASDTVMSLILEQLTYLFALDQ
jgi:mRNA interferase MazF